MSTQLRFDFVGAIELTPTARLVGEILNRTPARFSECWEATKTIAKRIGKSVRTVQLALRELADAGLVEVRRAYRTDDGRPLNSRRRILLLWRRATGQATPSLGAIDCAEVAPEIAPSLAPPRPPVEEPEGNTVVGNGEVADPPSTPVGSPLGSEAEAKAVALWGDTPAVRARVRELEEEHDPAHVAVAVEECARTAAKPGGWAVIGLAATLLRKWAALGGPPPKAASIARPEPRHNDAWFANLAAELTAGRPDDARDSACEEVVRC